MTQTYTYGAGTSPLGLTIYGWHLKSVKETESYETVNVVKTTDGYYIPASLKAVGKVKRIVETWEVDGDSSTACAVTLGSSGDVSAVDSASLSTSGSGRPTLTVNGHTHLDVETGSVHTAGSYEVEFAFPSGAYGAVNPFTGATITGLTDIEIQSSTQTATMDHQDEPSSTGKFLCGVSRGVKIEASLNATTDATPAIGANGGWTLRMKDGDKVNDQFRKLQITGEQYIDESA